MVNAIILAGGNGINEEYTKALVDINGKLMIEYVIEAFKSVGQIGDIVVVGPKNELAKALHGKVEKVVEGGSNIIQSITNGIQSMEDSGFIFVASADIPMITKEAIEDFLEKSKQSQADFCYPIVNKKVNDEKHPGIKRTYIKTRQGLFTGGNVLYINAKEFKKGEVIGQKLFKARKNPLKLAGILGIRPVLGLLTGTLSISNLEKKFSRVLGISAKAIITDYPEIGNDVDKESDLSYARQYLSVKSI